MHKLTLLIATLLITLTATAQPYGNAARARATAPKSHKALVEPQVRLGYLDNDTVTLQKFLDNLEVGLRADGFPDSKIISYALFTAPHLADEQPTSEVIKGNKIPRSIFTTYHLGTLQPGDKIYFEKIRIEYTRNAYRYVNPIVITINR